MRAAVRTCVSFANFAQIGEPGLEVATGLDAPKVHVVAVRADHVLALAQRLGGDYVDGDAERADRATARPEGLADLLGLGRAEVLAKRLQQLHLVEPVV